MKDIRYERLIGLEVPGGSQRFCRQDEDLKILYLPFIKHLCEKIFVPME